MSILANEPRTRRSAPNDSVSLYLRDMAATPLLTREEELDFARRIDAARVASMMQFAAYPAALDELASIKQEIVEGKAAIGSYVVGLSQEEGDAGLRDGMASGSVIEQEDSPERQAAIVAQLTRIDEAASALREAMRHEGYGCASYRRARRKLRARLATLRFTARTIERLTQSLALRRGGTHAQDAERPHDGGGYAFALPPALARRLLVRLQVIDRGAAGARVRLLKGNLRLVVSIARRYTERGLPLADLVQEGNIGLVKAIERYDHRRGFKFATYATWWIRQAVLHALGDQGRMIRVPVHTADSLSKLSRITLDHVHRSGGRPTHAMLAKKMGMPLDKLRDLTNIVRDPVSMETLAAPGSDVTVGEFVADDDMPTPEEVTMARHMRRAVLAAIDQLPTREANVLRLRFGIGVADEYSLREVGKQLNLSAERVRQIEVMAIERLRGAPGFAGLKDYVSVNGH
ncbi:RNA polymerase sigma factor RpoD/SigA [Trinickia dinghuensis]|uniref:RNA polymerase sigma factor n=1 Tax=Trinickia dinghuensis TaxID=2291023 RepID=A0A3D8JYH9_9BURK|nr:RNA polymerase sigma factor RpoD/SigA [Trinickia dinghuensis]RDU98207.1 RNA polymerase sigma factor RpoD/SigA [Trinickia dinghuensis]